MYAERTEQQKRIDKLAQDVLQLSRNTLLVNLRFLDAALAQLKPLVLDTVSLATDGEYLVYAPKHILCRYKEEKEASVRDYLHVILHCIFGHMYVGPAIRMEYWNLACDIAVESMIEDLNLKSASVKLQKEQRGVLDHLRNKLNLLSAEKIYRYYLDQTLSVEEMQRLEKIFKADDHKLWYLTADEKYALGIGRRRTPQGDGNGNGAEDSYIRLGQTTYQMRWKILSERMLQDLTYFAKGQGRQPGTMIQYLNEINREKYDYTTFLKKFAVRGEVMKINDDEFDHIFYTYGLQRYGKMPLIEPLEYKEVKRIREFVIAIDTSGSVAGDIVQKFVQKTYNILKTTESFFSKINLHIMQCDAEIQEDVVITTQKEFDAYIKQMKIRGLGGTDFRPVFHRVDELIKEKRFSNLRGLIYLTDGFGSFPERKPDYQTAFVFLKEDYYNPEVPSWAIKLVLRQEEI